MPTEGDAAPKKKKAASKKTTTRKKQSAAKAPAPKVTKEKVMVAVEIEEEGAGSIARYSGLFFVFAGAILSLFSLGGLHVETEQLVARTEYEANERMFSFLASRELLANIAATTVAVEQAQEESVVEEDGEPATFAAFPNTDTALVAADSLPAESEATTTTAEAAEPAASALFLAAQTSGAFNTSEPQLFSPNVFALVSALGVVMLGLVLLLASMYISRRKLERDISRTAPPAQTA